MINELTLENSNPIFPCICGHSITAHGEEIEIGESWEWDDDHKEEVCVQSPYPRPVCYECGPYDCYFVEMTNLEYLEFKSDNNKCS